ncbi:hypothetical protein C8Q76DRAFT_804324 [Earliella scabrosa]|nr:hypothetical protein C8Q76DRAFT_804324 [Earliella scabrosa]
MDTPNAQAATDQRTVQITVNASSNANTTANAIDATDATNWPPKDGWFTFPPFPKPPPGVEIVLFKDFKPLGIHILPEPDTNSDDEDKPSLPGERVERDALGVPTVTLRVHHDNTGMGKKKRKARTKMGANGQPVRVMWFEEWAEIENSRTWRGGLMPAAAIGSGAECDSTIGKRIVSAP